MTGIAITMIFNITRKERLMRKTNLSLLTDWFAKSHFASVRAKSCRRIAIIHSPFGLQSFNAFGKGFLKTMETKKKSFLIFPRGRNNDNVVQISSLTNIALS